MHTELDDSPCLFNQKCETFRKNRPSGRTPCPLFIPIGWSTLYGGGLSILISILGPCPPRIPMPVLAWRLCTDGRVPPETHVRYITTERTGSNGTDGTDGNGRDGRTFVPSCTFVCLCVPTLGPDSSCQKTRKRRVCHARLNL